MNKLLTAICLTLSLDTYSMSLKSLKAEVATDLNESTEIITYAQITALEAHIRRHHGFVSDVSSFRHFFFKRHLRSAIYQTQKNCNAAKVRLEQNYRANPTMRLHVHVNGNDIFDGQVRSDDFQRALPLLNQPHNHPNASSEYAPSESSHE